MKAIMQKLRALVVALLHAEFAQARKTFGLLILLLVADCHDAFVKAMDLGHHPVEKHRSNEPGKNQPENDGEGNSEVRERSLPGRRNNRLLANVQLHSYSVV